MQHKRTISRLLAGVLAALTIAIVGLATTAWAAEDDPATYQALADAIEKADANSTITLSGSWTGGDVKALSVSKSLTIDLNGKALTMTSNKITVGQGATLAIVDGTEEPTGKITFASEGSGIELTPAESSKSGGNLIVGDGVTIDISAVTGGMTIPDGSTDGGNPSNLTIRAGGTLVIGSESGSVTIEGSEKGASAASMNVEGNVTASTTGKITTNAVTNEGGNPGSLTVSGTVGASGKTVSIENNGTLNNDGGTIYGNITSADDCDTSGTIAGSITVSGGTLDVTSGSVTGSNNTAAITVSKGTVTVSGSGTVITGGETNGIGISASGVKDGDTVVKIQGGIIWGASQAQGIKVAEEATVNISGGVIHGGEGGSGLSGIAITGGEVNVTGSCEVYAYGDAKNGIAVTGGALTISAPITGTSPGAFINDYASSGGVITVNNGGSVSTVSSPVMALGNKNAQLTMAGGTITCTNGSGKSIGLSINGGTAVLNSGTISSKQYAVSFGSSGGSLRINNGATVGSDNNLAAIDSSAAGESSSVSIDITYGGRLDYASSGNPFNPMNSNFKGTVKAYAPYCLGYDNLTKEEALKKLADLGVTGVTIDSNEPDPGPPAPPTPTQVPVLTYYDWTGAAAKTQNGTSTEGTVGPWTFEEPTVPSRPGYVFLGWFTSTGSGAITRWTEYEGWGTATYTSGQNLTVTGIWAQIQVSLTPSTQVVAPGASVTITATPTISLADGVVGTGVTAPTSVAAPTATATPNTIKPTVSAGTTAGTLAVTFTAPSTQPSTVTIAVAYRGATNTSASGYATAQVIVANASAVTVASNSATMGNAVKGTAVLDDGLLPLSAAPAKGYEFVSWAFTPGEGVTWKPGADINLSSTNIQVPTYAGTWTATFQKAAEVTVYRLYNPYLNGAHLLTADQNELNTLTGLGWKSEGPRFTEYANAGSGGDPVYRLYNRNNGDHFYTASATERDALIALNQGWQSEGTAWYGAVTTTIPVYRLYNRYQTANAGLGNHLWTISTFERQSLIDLGWQPEGTGWYAVQGLEQ